VAERSSKRRLIDSRRRWRRRAAAAWTAARRDADLTQYELADRIGLSHDTIASIESGRRRLELGELLYLAEVLEIDPSKLLERILKW